MVKRGKEELHPISVLEAVETLASIAELDADHDVEISSKHDIVIEGQKMTYRTVNWLREEDPEETREIVKQAFQVILKYLRKVYRKRDDYIPDPKTIEGIKRIMVLVGEAAKKLDRYTDFFKKTRGKRVTNLKEYKQIQQFYHKKIDRGIDESLLGKWIMALSSGPWKTERELILRGYKTSQIKHVFVDLESVKKDTEYELFLLRKEDGGRFFNPRLLRNMMLISDFGEYFGDDVSEDPLIDVWYWQDHLVQSAARSILRSLNHDLERFYKVTSKYKNKPCISELHKALMALMLTANPNNLLENVPLKSCVEYFCDFQVFLRQALHSWEYQKMIAYPPKKSYQLGHAVLGLTHALCRGLYTRVRGYQEQIRTVDELLHAASDKFEKKASRKKGKGHQLTEKLKHDHDLMKKLAKLHSSGPLIKVLDLLQEGSAYGFDPLIQGNIPNQFFDLYLDHQKVSFLRMAAPTMQEFIHKAVVIEEFKGFLRGLAHQRGKKKHLIFNLQDRTSWREHARCSALEDLQKLEEFSKHLTVVTLPKDTDFYHQLAPYDEMNHAKTFIEQLIEHLESESSGFYFPEVVLSGLSGDFIPKLCSAIHQVFFHGRNVMTRDQRLEYIEIFYLFLELKIIEIVKPDTFSLTCKDGLDIGMASGAKMYAFLKLIHKKKLSDADLEFINLLLYGPAIFNRERIIISESFNRFYNAIKAVEIIRDEHGPTHFDRLVRKEFGKLFKSPILDSRIVIPHAPKSW